MNFLQSRSRKSTKLKYKLFDLPFRLLSRLIPRGDRRTNFLHSYMTDLRESPATFRWAYSLWLAGTVEALWNIEMNNKRRPGFLISTATIVFGLGFIHSSNMLAISGLCCFFVLAFLPENESKTRARILFLQASSLLLYASIAVPQWSALGGPTSPASSWLYIPIVFLALTISIQLGAINMARALLLGDTFAIRTVRSFALLQLAVTCELTLALMAANDGTLSIAFEPLETVQVYTQATGYCFACLTLVFAINQPKVTQPLLTPPV